MNEETLSKNQKEIQLSQKDYQAIARMMQWPDDLPKWDADNTPTNMGLLLGKFTVL